MPIKFSKGYESLFLVEPGKDMSDFLNQEVQTTFEIAEDFNIENTFFRLSTAENLKTSESIIQEICAWAEKGSEEEVTEKINLVDQKIVEFVNSQEKLTLATLILLGELDQKRTQTWLSDELTGALDFQYSFTPELQNQLSELAELNHPKGNLVLHKILDYAERHFMTLHEGTFTHTVAYDNQAHDNGFWFTFQKFAEEQAGKDNNHLLEKHFKNVLDITQFRRIDMHKEGRLEEDIAGSTDDAVIYTFKNIEAAYANRLNLGISTANTHMQPVFKLAPGLLGEYRNGKLINVYKEPDQNKAEEVIQSQLELNTQINKDSKEDFEDGFYKIFNRDWMHLSNKDKATQIRELNQTILTYFSWLESENRTLFVDIKKIDDFQDLPSFIRGRIYEMNDYCIADREKSGHTTSKKAEPLSDAEFKKLLNPSGKVTENQKYLYQYFSRLGTRKKEEEEFGISTENLEVYSHVQFLDYIRTRKTSEVTPLAKLVASKEDQSLREKIAAAFFACSQNPDFAQDIITLAKNSKDEDLNALLENYLRVVSKSQDLEGTLHNLFPNATTITDTEISKTARALQVRANELLHSWAENTSEKVDITKLQQIDEDIYLTAKALKNIKRSQGLEFKDINGAKLETQASRDLTDQQRTEILALQKQVREQDPEYKDDTELLQDLQRELRQYLQPESNTIFKLQYLGDKLVGFLHIHQDQDPEVVWMGGLNVHVDAQSSPFIDPIVEEARHQYFTKYTVRLEVLKEKPNLQSFYKRQGFEIKTDELGNPEENTQAGRTFLVMERPKG